jgi:hypothetical protein
MFCRLKKMDKKSLGHVTRVEMLPDDDWKLPFSLCPEPFSADHSVAWDGEKGKKIIKIRGPERAPPRSYRCD